MQSLQHHYQSGRDHRALSLINRYVDNLPPMPGVFPDYPAPTPAMVARWEIEEGLRFVCEATDQSGDCWFAPELHRLKGELFLQAGRRDEVVGCLDQALKAAQEQGARLLELRAAMSLSRVQQPQGRRNEAQGLLASIYGSFTEGLDTADLQEAKALLEETNWEVY